MSRSKWYRRSGSAWSVRTWAGVGGSIVLLLLVLTPMFSTSWTRRVQPQLLQLSMQQPAQTVSVIVQKTAPGSALENQVAELGGTVTKDLHIINAFAADLPAAAALQLAQADGVRWISLDGPVQTSASEKFTMWATSIGTAVANGFTNPNNALGMTGPNGTFASGSAVKGSFGGFQAEYAPGTVVTKVEVALRVYASTALNSSEVPTLKAYVNGNAGGAVSIAGNSFNPACVGASKVCTLYTDITASRSWRWSDFAPNKLEVLVDQSRLSRGKSIFYDGIGVRVTAAPGSDSSMPMLMTSATDNTAINTSVLTNVYPQVTRATNIWNESPYWQGAGMTIAVVDSGSYKTSGIGYRLVGIVNFNSTEANGTDQYGHGTFVSSVIGDDGTMSNGQYMGIAPRANLVAVRVADDNGMSYESDVVNALQWINDNKGTYNIRVVNLSMNAASAQSYNNSPLDAACEILWFNGTVVVASAGNSGSGAIYPPANDPFVITVGATDDLNTVSSSDDVMASFSAYGTDETGAVKPDLVAPGSNLIAYLPNTTKLTIPVNHPANVVNQYYFRMSGTSMAAPQVSGAAAIVLQARPTLNPDQVKYILRATANKSWPGYNATKAGAGYLDVYAAVHSTATGTANTNLAASQLLWTGSQPVTWGSVNWGSVNWGSVNWGSVNWGSVNWGSVNWGSDYWGN